MSFGSGVSDAYYSKGRGILDYIQTQASWTLTKIIKAKQDLVDAYSGLDVLQHNRGLSLAA